MFNQQHQQIIAELSNLNPPRDGFNNLLMLQAVKLFDNPQDAYKVIHVTGTNGKGSTTTYINDGLIAANYKVAKFISPYIIHINECITINNHNISDEELVGLYNFTKEKLLKANILLTSFEYLTLIMFLFAKAHAVDFLVLEVGMGGVNDATNVVNSIYAVITNISLEHTKFLGNNLSDIAIQKSGIIKNGITLIADNTPELIMAIKNKTTKFVNILSDYDFTVSLDYEHFTTKVKFKLKTAVDYQDITLRMFGEFQALNFLIAYHILNDLKIAKNIILHALSHTRLMGRMQIIENSKNYKVIIDAGHNLAGAQNLYTSFKNITQTNILFILNFLEDKDYRKMLDLYVKLSAEFFICPIKTNDRGLNPSIIAQYLQTTHNITPQIFDDLDTAIMLAKAQHNGYIIITGSIYLLQDFFNKA